MNKDKIIILKKEENFKDTLENELTKTNNEQKDIQIKNIKYKICWKSKMDRKWK